MERIFGFFFGAIVLFSILMVVFGIFYSGFLSFIMPVYDYFVHTRWGYAAIISLVLSFVFGYASKKTHEDVKIKDTLMRSVKTAVIDFDDSFSGFEESLKPALNERLTEEYAKELSEKQSQKYNKEESQMKALKDDESVIDLSTVNLQGLLMQMALAINKPAPVFFKNWSNKRYEADLKRMELFAEHIRSVRNIGHEFLQLKADAIFAPEKVEHFLTKSRAESKNEIDILTAQAKDLLDKYSHEEKDRELDRKLKEAEIKRVESVTDLAVKATERLDQLSSQDLTTVLTTIIDPNSTTKKPANPVDEDYKRLDLMMTEQEIRAKEIENLKAEIERKQMKDKYNRNKQ